MKTKSALFCLSTILVVACRHAPDGHSNGQSSALEHESSCSMPSTNGQVVLSRSQAELIDEYVEKYCDQTGNLGIGFVASHSYEHRFRQILKKTDDVELKRLYVLKHFCDGLERDIHDFEVGVVDLGKGEERAMTSEEKETIRHDLIEKLEILSILDPSDPEGVIDDFRTRLGDKKTKGDKSN